MKFFMFRNSQLLPTLNLLFLLKRKKGNVAFLISSFNFNFQFQQAFVSDAFYLVWVRALSNMFWEMEQKGPFFSYCYLIHTEVQWLYGKEYYSKSHLLWIGSKLLYVCFRSCWSFLTLFATIIRFILFIF